MRVEAELPGRSRRAGSACSGRSRTRGGPTQRPRKRSAGISSRRTTRPHRGHDEEYPKLLRMERRRERGMLASGPEEGKMMGSESGGPPHGNVAAERARQSEGQRPSRKRRRRGSGPARRKRSSGTSVPRSRGQRPERKSVATTHSDARRSGSRAPPRRAARGHARMAAVGERV